MDANTSESLFKPLLPYVLPFFIIVVACHFIIKAVRRIKRLDGNEIYQMTLPLQPAVLGSLLGFVLEYPFFPREAPLVAHLLTGAMGGLTSGQVFAFIRRVVRYILKKRFPNAPIDKFLAPADEGGLTLPPDGSVTAEKRSDAK